MHLQYISISIALAVAAFIHAGCPQEPPKDTSTPLSLDEIIQAAGNTASEKERYELMVSLQDHAEVQGQIKEELEELLPYIDRWANGREKYHVLGDQESAGEDGYLGGFFVQDIWPGDTTFPSAIRGLSPLYPIWCLYRGRMLIWQAIEMGILTEMYFTEGLSLLDEAATAFPKNTIIKTYLGTAQPWPYELTTVNDAPAWATAQRKALHHLEEIINFWITQRQAIDGQMGGGWGDDVEMWRKWTPVLLAFEHTASKEAQEKLASGIFALPRLENGYTHIMTDVEHSSEDSGDPLLAMLLLNPASEDWKNKANTLGDLMQNIWTAENDLGYLQFKSTYFTSNETSNNNSFACDTAYHVRAIQPTLLLWQRGQAQHFDSLFKNWLKTWAHSVNHDAAGKPLGVLPSAIHFPSGLPGGPNPYWWNPGCHITDKTFQYPRALSFMAQALMLAYLHTDDSVYLDPFYQMIDVWTQTQLEPTDSTSGNAQWAADKMRKYLPTALSKLRLMTGQTDFDDFISAEGDLWEKTHITPDENSITAALEQTVQSLSYNKAFFTEEVRFTDRVFKFHSNYFNDLSTTTIPNVDMDLLYNMLTGDIGPPNILTLAGVKWLTPPIDIAIWVSQNREDLFEASLYHFGTQERRLEAKLLRIDVTDAEISLECEGALRPTALSGTETDNVALDFSLPSQNLCVLKIARN